MIKLHTWWK